MRFLRFFVLFLTVLTVYASPVRAAWFSEITCAFYPCSGGGDFDRPYLYDGKTPHNSQFDNDAWVPQDWIDAKGGSAQEVVSGFYRAGIVTDQYTTLYSLSPVIEVGHGFMHLSGQDKRRVIEMVDYVGQYTAQKPGQTVLIYHKASGDEIGTYNAETGLQLQ